MGSSHLYGRDFYRRFAGGSQSSAEVVVPLLVDLLRPESVVDIGCGVGLWLAEFKRQGIPDVLGVDFGQVPRSEIRLDGSEFAVHDLSQPLRLGRRFDLALCLEVAEHLPASEADRLVAELTDLAPAVAFSAAVPHQGGVGHVNEQWPEYWAAKFAARSYAAVDAVRSRIWAEPAVDFWYAQNLILFVAASVIEDDEHLRAAADGTDPAALARVHPTLYLASAEAARRPLRATATKAVAALRRAAAMARPGSHGTGCEAPPPGSGP